MSKIADLVPLARLRQVDHIVVRASPEEAYAAFRHLDVTRFGVVRLLRGLRELAGLEPRGEVDPVGAPYGFRLVEDEPGRGVVIGSIGRFWKGDPEVAHVTPDGFAAFHEHGWVKLAWSLWATPHPHGAVVTFEVRACATDDAAWRAFHRTFALFGPFAGALRRVVLGWLEAELGAAEEPAFAERPLPGDELSDRAQRAVTWAIDVPAPVEDVWPHLARLGGANDPEDGYAVLRSEPPRLLVLGADFDADLGRCLGPDERGGRHVRPVTRTLFLEPAGREACRLIIRVVGRTTRPFTELTWVRLVGPVLQAAVEHDERRPAQPAGHAA